MPANSWQEHDGVRYLYCDMRSVTPEEYADTIFEAWRMREEQPGPVVTLSDVRGVTYLPPPELRAEIKRLTNDSARRLPSAVVSVGLVGMPAVFMRGLTLVGGGMRMVPARSWDQALALVVREARRLDRNHNS